MQTAFLLILDAWKRVISQVSARGMVLSAACLSAVEQAATVGLVPDSSPADTGSPCSAPPAESPVQGRDKRAAFSLSIMPGQTALPCATLCGRPLRRGGRGARRAPQELWARRGHGLGRWGGRGRCQHKMPFILRL